MGPMMGASRIHFYQYYMENMQILWMGLKINKDIADKR